MVGQKEGSMSAVGVQLAVIARRRYWREAEARAVVEAWRRSSEPIASFARRHGIHPQRVARWAARIKVAGVVRFHAVRLTPAAIDETRSIEIQLDGGWRVLVPRDFHSEDLRRVLAVLDERTTC
jgi:hypothetical protein